MIVRKEAGHILLSLLIVLALGVFVLYSINEYVSSYLLQERILRQEILVKDMREELFRQRVGQEGFWQSIKRESVGLADNCRVQGGESKYIAFPIGWYGRYLLDECSFGGVRGLVGVYNVEKGSLVERVGYTYVVREILVDKSPRVEAWAIVIVDEQVHIEVLYRGSYYQYIFAEEVDVSNIVFLQSVDSEGFSFIVQNQLWRLPIEEGKPYVVSELLLDEGVILADLINDKGVYLLQLKSSETSGESDIYITHYASEVRKRSFDSAEKIGVISLNVDSWRLLQVDNFRVFVELVSRGDAFLLALNWSGDVVWGGRHIWLNGEVDCPLQAEPFEPIPGWVLGCQRSQIFKVHI